MLKQGSVEQLRRGHISRADAYVAVCMAHYPRGLKKELMDEYRTHLAPDKALLADFKKAAETVGHDPAFASVQYEERFRLDPGAWESLRRLSDKAAKQDVYLICQCEMGLRCHREILLLLAHERFKTPIGPVHHEYPAVRRCATPK